MSAAIKINTAVSHTVNHFAALRFPAREAYADNAITTLSIGDRHLREHELSASFNAVRFVKQITSDTARMPLLNSLAEALTPLMPKNYEGDIRRDLADLGDLQNKNRGNWDTMAQGDLVEAINQFIFRPNDLDFLVAMAGQGHEGAQANREQELRKLAGTFLVRYFQRLGKTIPSMDLDVHNQELTPEKIVIEGHLGEMCNNLSDLLQKFASHHIEQGAGLPKGAVSFGSPVSPCVEELEAELRLPSVNGLRLAGNHR